MKMKEYLEKRIDRELLNVKKNSRENRGGKTFQRKLPDALCNFKKTWTRSHVRSN